jgi:hypothetical protein
MLRHTYNFLVTLFADGCSTAQRLDTLRPEPDASPIFYEKKLSFINHQ